MSLGIVVALDLSPASRAALQRARALSGPDGALHLVHVVESTLETASPPYERPRRIEELRRRREREANLELERLAAGIREAEPRLEVSVSVRYGELLPELIEACRARRADLLAAGAHGKGLLDRLVLGSVAEALVRRSPIPVLVVREEPGETVRPFARVVVALDVSRLSAAAARVADRVASSIGAPLEGLHVVDVARLPLQVAAPFDPALASAEVRDALRDAPRAIETELADAGVRAPRVSVVAGDPGPGLVERLTRDDLIVCGTHGRGALLRAAFGSVATHLLRHAPCPVLVVRGTTPTA